MLGFSIYVLRWIVSGIVMIPIMQFFEPYLSLWANLLVTQIIGSFIFFVIDKTIFKHINVSETPDTSEVSEPQKH